MEIQNYIDQKKQVQSYILDFIENGDQDNLINLKIIVEEQKILENRVEFAAFLRLISQISKNHHRVPEFYDRLEQILTYYDKEIKQTFTNSEIFNFYKTDKRMTYLLLEKGLVTLDKNMAKYIFKKNDKYNKNSVLYFWKYLEGSLDERKKKMLARKFSKNDSETQSKFDKKCQIGENDTEIATFIRNDSVQEFIQYINMNHISVNVKIKPSLFETNRFLIEKEPSLIEYAAFFGSIQIFQYLKMNNAEIEKSIWLFAIHSKNAELIHLIESCHLLDDDDKFYEDILKEAIICHHNDLSEYIKNILPQKFMNYDGEKKFWRNINTECFHSYNYFNFPDECVNKYVLHDACRYNYLEIVQLLLKMISFDLNENIISIIF